ncbi:MAG: DUF4124 domain-containing protein [Bacillota bacterium]
MRIASLVIASIVALGAQAQIYKWVDEKGVTHYGEAPPQDRKATKVDVPSNPPDLKPPPAQDWSKKEIEFRKRQLDRDTKEKADVQQQERRERECSQARADLAFQSQPGRHYRMNDKGEKIFKTDDQQAEVVEAAKKRVEEYCR